ncbi:CHAP domain-containing protein [Demequina sp.]|uniref:CHAP domain-containing protein n=1 Tax=Demequina sp. TaxID=2050685 RepID=UPI003D0D9A0F
MASRPLRATFVALLTLVLAATAETAVAADVPASSPLGSRQLAMAPGDSVSVTAPDQVVKGTRMYITAKGDGSLSGKGTVEWSTDQTEWHTSATTIPVEDGQGATSWLPTKSAYYRIVGDGIQSAVWRTDVVSKSGYAISAGTRSAQVHSLESAYLGGSAVKDGKGGAYKVRVEVRLSDGTWKSVGTVKASSAGNFTVRVRLSADRTFRARILSSSGSTLATSPTFEVELNGGTSTLEERRALMAWRLGAATTAIRAIAADEVAAAKYTGGAESARIQKFKKGFLVEVTETGGTKRTWVIEGKQLTGYLDRSAWHGSLGLPERDVKCGLLEGGCVQLFSGGAIYTNTSSMSKGIYVAYGRWPQVETLAAAYSQKYYEEPSWRESKYNEWVGGTHAWCQVFVAWSTYAAGRSGEAPVRTYFPHYVTAVKASPALIRDPKASEIRAGDILLFDWGNGTPTHTGFAVKVSGNYVYTFEGNTTDGTADPQRGVYARKRPLSGVWGLYHPGEYAANS